jgi:DNA polymerase I-like protein with 3'-5' exonuclease and polymerase domains
MTDPHKLHRKYAPDTSVEAAYALNSTRLEAMVYQCIHSFGPRGCISDEVRAKFPDLTYSSVTARYKALLDLGAITTIGKRAGNSGRNQRIMVSAMFIQQESRKPMDIITIDFETYYAKGYSLSGMTTEEYIRHDNFEVIGVGVKVNDNPADWYTGSDPRTFLNSLDYTDKAILCHNTAFDGAILGWHFGIKPKFWFDTLSMAKPEYAVMVGGSLKNLVLKFGLGEKGTEVVNAFGKRRKDFTAAEIKAYGKYCINDCDLTYKLFKELRKGFPVSELMVIDQTIRMYTQPVIELDRFKLERHLAEEISRKQTLLNRLGRGDPEEGKRVVTSSAKFAALLEAFGAEVPMKVSPITGKLTTAFAKTDQGMKDLLEHPDPRVRMITDVRLGTKSNIEEKRTARLIEVSKRGPLPIMLNYYGAHTGRFSGGDKLNLQNLPSRGNNTIRTAICAPEGQKLIACDSSQIEARMLAYVAEQNDLVEAFRQGRDVYSEFAALVYGIAVEHVTKAQRFVGKTCILGLGYGMGWFKFRDTLKQAGVEVDEREAKRIVYLYRDTYPKIKALWTRCDSALADMMSGQGGQLGVCAYNPEGILLPNNMMLRYNALRKGDDGFEYINNNKVFQKFIANKVSNGGQDITWTKLYGGKVTENIIQALARIVITDQMTAIGQHYHVIFQVHDEIIIATSEGEAHATQQVVEQLMSVPPAWAPTLPVACESGVGDNYGECK